MSKYSDTSRKTFEAALSALDGQLPRELLDALRELYENEKIDSIDEIQRAIGRSIREPTDAD